MIRWAALLWLIVDDGWRTAELVVLALLYLAGTAFWWYVVLSPNAWRWREVGLLW